MKERLCSKNTQYLLTPSLPIIELGTQETQKSTHPGCTVQIALFLFFFGLFEKGQDSYNNYCTDKRPKAVLQGFRETIGNE